MRSGMMFLRLDVKDQARSDAIDRKIADITIQLMDYKLQGTAFLRQRDVEVAFIKR